MAYERIIGKDCPAVERKGSDVIPIPGGVVQEACGGDGLSQMVCKHENDDPNKPGKWDFNPNKPKCRERWEKCSTKSEKLQKVGSKKLVKRSTQPSSSSLSDGETMNLDERAVPPPVTQIAIFRWESTHCVPADPNIPCPWSNGYSDPNIGTRGARDFTCDPVGRHIWECDKTDDRVENWKWSNPHECSKGCSTQGDHLLDARKCAFEAGKDSNGECLVCRVCQDTPALGDEDVCWGAWA